MKDIITLIDFLRKYPNQWHSYGTDARTEKALQGAMQLYSNIELSTISNHMRWN